ncbi:AAA family ATPase [Halomonas ramblicola]|uniref:AAA family ATPase n=1 Tax=Halomonas ramblicola TaxID=747349 RepID=UPI0025B5F83B|nr:AAA family ATPase [Halomonas ramblicola]MDN3522561.1 AAA family ATPase [Halomonas ramblicola]
MSQREPRTTAEAAPAYRHGREHLRDELAVLDLFLRRRVARFRDGLLDADGAPVHELAGSAHRPYIPHGEVDWLLESSTPPRHDQEALSRAIQRAQRRIDDRVGGALSAGTLLPLVQLARLFRLTDFEYQCLIACLAPELYRKYDTLYAYLHDDIARKRPSVELMLDLFCDDDDERWSARGLLTDDGVLLEAGLLYGVDDVASLSGASGLARFLAVDTRILHFVLGNDLLDPWLRGHARLAEATVSLPEVILPEALKASVTATVEQGLSGRDDAHKLLVHLHGPEGIGKRTLAAAIAAEFGTALLVLDMEVVAAGDSPERLIQRAFRESLLLQTPLCLENADVLLEADATARRLGRSLFRWADETGWLGFVLTSRPWTGYDMPEGVRLTSAALPMPDVELRWQAWQRYLGECCASARLHDVAQRFRLTVGRICRASKVARQDLSPGQGLGDRELYAACRGTAHHSLERLAGKVEPVHDWQDLVLPPQVVAHLEALRAQVRQGHRVLSEWGFAGSITGGRALSALFTGSPGTGKTMAAQVIANDLGLDLYRIDLSSVVSKYIGETEKHLAQIFDEAQRSDSILLFDECDALFGKRTEVTDAHDRYANIEVSFLLQKLEAYEGIVILTTNLRKNIDEAFVRRLRFIVEFPFPDEASRRRIWRAHIPRQAPMAADVDLDFLADKLTVPGGTIRNIVLNAAFLAAEKEEAIGMTHLIDSARREYEKIGKLWDERQLGERTWRPMKEEVVNG